MVVTGWFGWSVLWLSPLLWRLAKTFLFKSARLRGNGSIRLWLGTFLVLCSSSALEALVRTEEGAPDDGVVVGQFIAAFVADVFGFAFAVFLLVATAFFTLPWLFGGSAFRFIGGCYRACVNLVKGRERSDNRAPARYPIEEPVSARPVRESMRPTGGVSSQNIEPWKLPALFFGKDSLGKASARSSATEKRTPAARSTEEWAPFERIRPTSAMLARAGTAQAENVRNQQRQTTSVFVSPQRASGDGNLQDRQDREPVRKMTGALPRAPVAAPAASVRHNHPPLTAAEAEAPLVPSGAPAESQPQLRQSAEHTVPSADETGPTEVAELTVHDTVPSPSKPEEPVAPSSPLSISMQAEEPEQTIRPAIVVSGQRAVMGEPFAFQAPADLGVELPGMDLLDMPSDVAIEVSETALAETAQLIEQRLKEFKVPVTVLGACAGPVITRFDIEPAVGVRGAQIVGLMKDLSRALGLTSIRVVETIPGKTCMGLELPNAHRQMIRLSEMLESEAYCASRSHLTLAMGKDITGTPVVTDLARAPHMLVAGTTGSGKSVAINAMILSLLYKATPADVRMIMIDPKMLELSVYDGIPHLLAPVVTDMKLAANALTWCVGEMEKRYRLMSALGVRNLAGFNQKIRDGRAAEKYVTNPFSLTPDAPEPLSTLPTIVVVIDELADLMMVTGKKIEELIARLAQKARAAGIHLILATQRPSVDVITGLIKANIPTRVAFQVSSKIDSRTILDQMGAETLLGHGDMLFLPPGSGYPQRVHGAFVSDEEVHRVVEYLKQFGEPEYEEAILAGAPSEEASADLFGDNGGTESDPLYDEAVAFVLRTRRASISSVQRQLRIGYNRAARLVEQMEAAGILSPMASNGSREVLAPASD